MCCLLLLWTLVETLVKCICILSDKCHNDVIDDVMWYDVMDDIMVMSCMMS